MVLNSVTAVGIAALSPVAFWTHLYCFYIRRIIFEVVLLAKLIAGD